ncbi:MAG: septal ring lytic transglycosylase RlpA family protein [Candidatus Aminicenantales bacterium]
MAKRIALLFLVLGMFASCSRSRVNSFPKGGAETGVASWYGPDFHGKPTSNKETYDMYDMTAAHRALPFGTVVMVTNLDNGRTATVRINDRGPFVDDRIIDLSYAAARVLDMVGPGTARVRLEVLRDLSPPPGSQQWSIQAGSFVSKDNATALADRLRLSYRDVYVSEFRTSEQTYHRVRIGAPDEEAARALAERLAGDGFAVIVLEER